MYIIYNEDGSIKKVNLTDFIQKGNNNVNNIFIGINKRSNSTWGCSVLFTLPDGSITSTTPTLSTKTIDGVQYDGWSIAIPANATIYEGNVKFSVNIANLNQQVLFTYKGIITINPSNATPDDTTISYAQYQHVLELVLQKPSPRQTFIVFDDIEEADLSIYDDGQLFYDKESNQFYILENGELETYTAIEFAIEFADDSDIDDLFNDNEE